MRIVHVNKSFGSKSRASAIRANVDNFVDLLQRKKTEYACRDAIFKLLEILFWSIRPFAKLFSPHKKSLRHLSVYGNRPMRHHIGYLRLFSNFSRHCRNSEIVSYTYLLLSFFLLVKLFFKTKRNAIPDFKGFCPLESCAFYRLLTPYRFFSSRVLPWIEL